jgi:hypothetical protein
VLSIYWLRSTATVSNRGRIGRSELGSAHTPTAASCSNGSATSLVHWPLGIRLAIPGLVALQRRVCDWPRPIDWSISAALVGLFHVPLHRESSIYGQALAGMAREIRVCWHEARRWPMAI